MVMQYMVIVECISSGILYVDEIISRGYKPLVINTKNPTEDALNYRRIVAQRYSDRIEFIDEKEDFDVFIEDLKKYEIVAAFPGAETGVRLADRIVKALDLRGNDPETTYLRCNKAGMYEALGKAGIRRIESAHVHSDDDIISFWNEHELEICVMKFAETAGTVGLKICKTLEDAIDYYKVLQDMPTFFGEVHADVLIQEYIDGTEYIVNTLSCNGEHMLTDMWVYAKIRAEDGTLAYDYTKLVKELEPGHSDAIRYVYSVLDAVDMKWGLCHTEIKIDRKGPVLIETNARPMGLAMTQSYLDEALGHHQTDLALTVYLDPTRFERMKVKPYRPRKYALMKLMIVPEDIRGSFAPTFVISNMIRSSREILFFGLEGVSSYHRTIDLETSPLTIKMINEDYGELMRDYEMIRLIESNYFHLFYSLGEKVESCDHRSNIGGILRHLDPARRYLIVKDGTEYIGQYGKIEKNEDDWQIYDGVIYAESGETVAEERYRAMFRSMYGVRSGGYCVVVPESYTNLKSGSVVVEFLMNLAGVEVIAPPYDSVGIIIGQKK